MVSSTSPHVPIAEQPSTVVVIGGGLGGLSAAIHLRLAGHAVTLLEANQRVGGRANLIERDGFRFDTGPSLLNYPWVFQDLFRAAGREMSDYVELLPVDPTVQFNWQDGARLTLSSDIYALREEFERVEPGSAPGLLAFLADAEAKYQIAFQKLVNRNADGPLGWFSRLSLGEMLKLSVWRSLDGELRRFFRSRHIREALGSYAMYLGGSPFELPGLFSILPFGELAYGLWLPRGGIYAMVSAIERLAAELGVHIRCGHRVRRILIQDGRVQGVELADGTTLPARVIVSNVDVPTTNAELVPDEVRAKPSRMTPGVITFYWGVRGEVNGAAHHAIYLPHDVPRAFHDLFKRRRVPENLPFYVSIPSATDRSLATDGHSSVFVLVPTPILSDLGDVDWPQLTTRVRREVLERLAQHGVSLRGEQIVLEECWTPADWRSRFGLFEGSAFGAAHSLFQVGPFRSPNRSPHISGLYYVGASTTPGTGMPMVLLSGKLTAERVAEASVA